MKDITTLSEEIDVVVPPHGGMPKTTGPALNGLLKSLATEVTTRPGSSSVSEVDAFTDLPNLGVTEHLYVIRATNQVFRWDAATMAYVPAVTTSAILATEQQHTQELANVVHRSGDETISGNKTFTSNLIIQGNGNTGVLNVLNLSTDSDAGTVSMGGFFAPNSPYDTYFTVGNALALQLAALIGFSKKDGSYAFLTTYGRPASDLAVTVNGSVGMGTTTPSERLEVTGNVKAVKFIGDGSLLTNLPAPANTNALAEGSNNLYFTNARAQSAVATTKADLVSGKVPAVQIPYLGVTPQAIRNEVLNGTFYQGELSSAIPVGSTPGMKFSAGNGTNNYVYEYMSSSNDTTGTLFTWIRYVRN
jgi:hypothetical protein